MFLARGRADHHNRQAERLPGQGHRRPKRITAGPDGALWFTNIYGHSIGRITTTGEISLYRDKKINGSEWITVGPDKALWFTNWNSIGRITTTGKISIYRDKSIDGSNGITVGPDKALWFTNYGGGSIGRARIIAVR